MTKKQLLKKVHSIPVEDANDWLDSLSNEDLDKLEEALAEQVKKEEETISGLKQDIKNLKYRMVN